MTGKADAVRAVSEQFKAKLIEVVDGVMAHLRDDNAKKILGPVLSPLIGRGSPKSIVTFALSADVLRMVRDIVMADGEISDEEVQESLGLMSVLAAGFAKVRKEYASFAQLTPGTARQFLTQYESDAGLFGHANEATKWAGVQVCRNVEAVDGGSGPLKAFGSSLVAWAEAIAASDEVEATEGDVLRSLHAVVGRVRTAHTGKHMLTMTIAEQFLADDSSTELGSFSDIEEEAVSCLANACSALDLSGLRELTVASARSLAQCRQSIDLSGLKELSDPVATELARSVGERSFDGITRLPVHQARIFGAESKATFGSLETIDGLSCSTSQMPRSLPPSEEMPLCAALLGWASRRIMRPEVQGEPLSLSDREFGLLATHFPRNIPLHLAGWFSPLSPDALKALASFKGTVVIEPDSLEGGAMNERFANVIAGMQATAILFWSLPEDDEPYFPSMSPEAATALLPFRGQFLGHPSLLMFGPEVFEVLQQHPSVEQWTGNVTVSAHVCCRGCGEIYPIQSGSDAFPEMYTAWGSELRSREWRQDNQWGWLCEDCVSTATAVGFAIHDADADDCDNHDEEDSEAKQGTGEVEEWDDDESEDSDEDG